MTEQEIKDLIEYVICNCEHHSVIKPEGIPVTKIEEDDHFWLSLQPSNMSEGSQKYRKLRAEALARLAIEKFSTRP